VYSALPATRDCQYVKQTERRGTVKQLGKILQLLVANALNEIGLKETRCEVMDLIRLAQDSDQW
jgi:hypothetical protein